LTKEQAVLLRLVRAALTQTSVDLSDETTVDWNAVAEEARMQAVSNLAYEALTTSSAPIDSDALNNWAMQAYTFAATDSHIDFVQQELVALLEQNGYPYVILKGATAASYYPKPECRLQGDIDFLIDPAQVEAVTALLRENGYAVVGQASANHLTFVKTKVLLEMHFREPAIPQGVIGDRIRRFLDGNVRQPQVLDNGTHRFLAPTDSRHGLIAILHMQHHMLGEGIGLRHLCDWGCFVQKTATAPFWTELLGVLRDIGLLTYAAHVTRLCAQYLGTPLPDWATVANPAVCDELLEDILTGGNFGKKDVRHARSGMMITHSTSDSTSRSRVHYLYHSLVNTIRHTHSSVKRYPILYPVFAIKIGCQYVVRCLRGERLSIGKLASIAKKRRAIYHKLHIFEVETL
jgi:hypothetical protein